MNTLQKNITNIEMQIKQLSSLIDAGEKKIENLYELFFDQFMNTLKPKKFKNKTEKMVALCSRNYKGYVRKELIDIYSKFIENHQEYNALLNAVRAARAARFQLSKDYAIEIEKEKSKNKTYADTSNFVYKFTHAEGSSMPNLPWERIF